MSVEFVYLSLGSNLGDSESNLGRAIALLEENSRIRVTALSSIYETDPVGVEDQPPFLNMAAEIETDLSPLELLNAVKDIEARMGRRPTRRWGPRLIDLDLVLWPGRKMATSELTLPHEEFRNRAFVLRPLLELEPRMRDPRDGRPLAEHLAALSNQGVESYGRLASR